MKKILYCPTCKKFVEVHKFNQCPNCFMCIPKIKEKKQ